MWNKFMFAVWRKVFRANKAMELLRKDKGLVKKYRGGWAGAERGWVMRF